MADCPGSGCVPVPIQTPDGFSGYGKCSGCNWYHKLRQDGFVRRHSWPGWKRYPDDSPTEAAIPGYNGPVVDLGVIEV
jgi:hypothetical protein